MHDLPFSEMESVKPLDPEPTEHTEHTEHTEPTEHTEHTEPTGQSTKFFHLRYEPKWIHDAATVLKGKVCSSQYFSV